MHAEDRPIHFSTELIHPPLQHKVQALQKFYYELSQTRTAYDSTDFSAPAQYRFYTRRGPNSQSLALFLPDRLVLVEEWAQITASEFCDKVREVAMRAMAQLAVPFFAAQTVTVRSTFSLTHFGDARIFLLDHACGQGERIGPYFRRPVSVGGLRFVLPETPEHRGALHIAIESFRHNVREIFVEVKGIFGGERLDSGSFETGLDNIREVREFIIGNIFPYLDQFDLPQEQPE
jgi:hypothetical protein